jgi:hypothetical protein
MNNAEITAVLRTWEVAVVIAAAALIQLQFCAVAGGTAELALESVVACSSERKQTFLVQAMRA